MSSATSTATAAAPLSRARALSSGYAAAHARASQAAAGSGAPPPWTADGRDKLIADPRAYISFLELSLERACAAAAVAEAHAAQLALHGERLEAQQQLLLQLSDRLLQQQAYAERQGDEAGGALASAVVGLNTLGGRVEAQAASLAHVAAQLQAAERRGAEQALRLAALEAGAERSLREIAAANAARGESEAALLALRSELTHGAAAAERVAAERAVQAELLVRQAEARASDAASDARSVARACARASDTAVAAEAAAIEAADSAAQASAAAEASAVAARVAAGSADAASGACAAADARAQGALLAVLQGSRGGESGSSADAPVVQAAAPVAPAPRAAARATSAAAVEVAVARVLEAVESELSRLRALVKENAAGARRDLADLARDIAELSRRVEDGLAGLASRAVAAEFEARLLSEAVAAETRLLLAKTSQGAERALDALRSELVAEVVAVRAEGGSQAAAVRADVGADILKAQTRLAAQAAEAADAQKQMALLRDLVTATAAGTEELRAALMTTAAEQRDDNAELRGEARALVSAAAATLSALVDEARAEARSLVAAAASSASVEAQAVAESVGAELSRRLALATTADAVAETVSATAAVLQRRIERVAAAWAGWGQEQDGEVQRLGIALGQVQRQLRDVIGSSGVPPPAALHEQPLQPSWAAALEDLRATVATHASAAGAEQRQMLTLADGLVRQWQEARADLASLKSELRSSISAAAASAVWPAAAASGAAATSEASLAPSSAALEEILRSTSPVRRLGTSSTLPAPHDGMLQAPAVASVPSAAAALAPVPAATAELVAAPALTGRRPSIVVGSRRPSVSSLASTSLSRRPSASASDSRLAAGLSAVEGSPLPAFYVERAAELGVTLRARSRPSSVELGASRPPSRPGTPR